MALAVYGCGAVPTASADDMLQVTGVVLDVDGPDAATVERFSLNSDAGVIVDFVVGTLDVADGGLPAAHLRDHLVSGEPVTVTYNVRADGANVALRYVDAD